MVGTPTYVGDFVVLTKGGGHYAAKLKLGRVVRLTGKGVGARCVWFGQTWDDVNAQPPRPASWQLASGDWVAQPHKFLRITQHSIPPAAFILLDQMEIE